jgi:hypothetical protein
LILPRDETVAAPSWHAPSKKEGHGGDNLSHGLLSVQIYQQVEKEKVNFFKYAVKTGFEH